MVSRTSPTSRRWCLGQALPHACRCRLGDIKGVEDEDVVVVLGQGDNVALGRDLQPAAPGHLQAVDGEVD